MNMVALYSLKKMLRLGCSTFSFTFASKSRRFVAGDQNPSHFSLENHRLLCTHMITSEASVNHDQNFTVDYLINSCGLSPEGAISASKWFRLQSSEKADSALALFRNHGFSETQISKVVRSLPRVLTANFGKTLLPKLEFFSSIGVSRENLARIVACNPTLLAQSLEKFISTHGFLRSMLSEESVIAVLKNGSRIFLVNHSTNVVPNITLLRELGMPESIISLSLVHFTRLLILKPERFARLVGEVKEMGVNMKTSTCLWAMWILCCRNTLNRSRKIYMSRWGWSEDDALCAFRKFPQCMLVSEKKIMQTMDFLVNEMGWPSQMMAKYAKVFSYTLEKRLIPRCSVCKVLLSKGLINQDFSLNYVLKFSEKQFLERFVTKFVDQVPQLLSVYQGNVDIQDVTS
ncbi:hypothetical protein M0R45_036584 [Rubus argutus]|uniref:Uncharacterized protein n=1 Tax=Rubus argutus TaxID=59490 RepID=A0AAW1VZ88_RUBAR